MKELPVDYLSARMLTALRGRRGLNEMDTSADSEIKKMTPVEAVRETAAWEMGDPSWANVFADWMDQVGANPRDFRK